MPHSYDNHELIELQACADPTRKRRGEAAEAAFLARVTSLGFSICSPWGDSDRYDFVVDSAHGFSRVQVKCTQRYADSRYRVKNTGTSYAAYTPAEIDFVAALVVPIDLWYIVPIEAAGSRKGLRFYPQNGRHSLFEKYREAWCLLDCPRDRRGPEDIPTTCRSKDLPTRCALCPLKK
jgi:PD-(D/E)XK endonuclease